MQLDPERLLNLYQTQESTAVKYTLANKLLYSTYNIMFNNYFIPYFSLML